MPWFRVDDKLHDHRKARAARKAAMGVWVLAGSWSADNLTNGFIPRSILPRWGTTADARCLVQVGLWTPDEQDGEKGWRFHAWEEFQPTREEVESKRSAARDRMARVRGARRTTPAGSQDVRANSERTSQPVRDALSLTLSLPAAAAATRATADPPPAPAPAAAQTPLPPPLEILRTKLEARRLVVRWDTLGPERTAQIEHLIDLHGDGPLIDSALRAYRADSPPAYAQAWLAGWLALPAPGTRLQVVPDPPCPTHGRPGTTTRCASCAADRLAGER